MRIPFILAAMVAAALFVLPAITRPVRVAETLPKSRPVPAVTASCPHGGWRYQAPAHRLYDRLDPARRDGTTGSIVCTQ